MQGTNGRAIHTKKFQRFALGMTLCLCVCVRVSDWVCSFRKYFLLVLPGVMTKGKRLNVRFYITFFLFYGKCCVYVFDREKGCARSVHNYVVWGDELRWASLRCRRSGWRSASGMFGNLKKSMETESRRGRVEHHSPSAWFRADTRLADVMHCCAC